MARFVAAGPPSMPELAVLVAVSTVTALVFFKLRLPGRADVRRHAGVRHPARRRLYSLDPALVGGLSRR